MNQSAIQTKQITPTQHGVADHHPAPIITQTNRTPERCIPETFYLTAIDPEISAQTIEHLNVLLINHDEDAPIWLDLMTNNPSFAFICKVVRAHFKRNVCIYGTRDATAPF